MLVGQFRQRVTQGVRFIADSIRAETVGSLRFGGVADLVNASPLDHTASQSVRTLVGDDSIGPGPESGRVVESADGTDDGQPRVLDDVLRLFALSGQSPGEARQAWMPSLNQRPQRVTIAFLAFQDQQLVVNIVGRPAHRRWGYSRTMGTAVQPFF